MTVEQDAAHEEIRVRGQTFVDKVKGLVHEGNVRRLVIKDDHGYTIMEIPVTAGVVAAVVAPVVTAIGAFAALANEWSVEVERHEPPAETVDQDGETG